MTQYPKLDGQTLEIASFSDIPKQPVTLNQNTSYLGKQLRAVQTMLAQPVVNSQAPLTIVRRNLGGGNLQFRVQFIAPTQAEDPNYQSTTVVLQTPSGTVRFAAAAAAGPVIFNSTRTTQPGSLALQQDNVNGSSSVSLGVGNSRSLIQQ